MPNWPVTGKICKKFNSHNCCHIGWIGCPILQVAHKATVRFQFLAYFCNALIKLTWKRLSIGAGRLFVVFNPSRNIPCCRALKQRTFVDISNSWLHTSFSYYHFDISFKCFNDIRRGCYELSRVSRILVWGNLLRLCRGSGRPFFVKAWATRPLLTV